MFRLKRIYFEFLMMTLFVVLSLLLSSHKSIWRDEAFSMLLGQESLLSIIDISVHDFNPPLFYLLLGGVMKLFGSYFMIVRILPLMFSIITIWLFLKVRSDIFNITGIKDTGRSGIIFSGIYYLLIILSNGLLYFSAELRPYSMQILLVTLSSIFSVRFLEKRSGYNATWLMLVYTLMIYSHTMGILWVFSQGFVVGLLLAGGRRWQLLKQFLFLNIGFLVLAGSWIYVLIGQKDRATADFWITFDPYHSLQQFIGIFTGVERIDELPTYIWYLDLFRAAKYLVYMGCLYTVVAVKRLWPVLFSFVMMMAVIYFYSYFFNPILYSRYVSLMIPLGLLAVFLGMVAVWKGTDWLMKITKIRAAWLPFTMVVGVALFYFWLNIRVFPDLIYQLNKTDYRRLAEFKLPVYTDEELDVMSCIYYAADCTFVGSLKDTHAYVGISRFARTLTVSEWAGIQDEQFVIDYKSYHSEEITNRLMELGYTLSTPMDLGDNTLVMVVSR